MLITPGRVWFVFRMRPVHSIRYSRAASYVEINLRGRCTPVHQNLGDKTKKAMLGLKDAPEQNTAPALWLCSFALLYIPSHLTVNRVDHLYPVTCLAVTHPSARRFTVESIKLLRHSSSWNRRPSWMVSATLHASFFFQSTLVRDQQVPFNPCLCDLEVIWVLSHPEGLSLAFHGPLKQHTSRLPWAERCTFRVPMPLWWHNDLSSVQIVFKCLYSPTFEMSLFGKDWSLRLNPIHPSSPLPFCFHVHLKVSWLWYR